MIDVKETAGAIEHIIRNLEGYKTDLERIKRIMLEKEDISYVSEALQTIRNMFGNLRIDLLITRPIRQFEMEIKKLEDKLLDSQVKCDLLGGDE